MSPGGKRHRKQVQQQDDGSVQITDPEDGSVITVPQDAWETMLNTVYEKCASYFQNASADQQNAFGALGILAYGAEGSASLSSAPDLGQLLGI